MAASHLYAQALAELWLALLQALVAEVLKRAGKYVGEQMVPDKALGRGLAEVTEKIRKSKLGAQAADWFEKNFEQIRKLLRGLAP